jgi:PBP1b-binding outer membrane lipoprotein LpoB
VSRTEINYYKLTVEVTDLESGLIAWTTEKEFARAARLPLIGW